ncbi:MAG TPA: tetratricopeptide repeat protein [Bryobacteraceae bacterium]|nr:tetratricopeptide repeat protein [Bryobacteraceae bacterium]
MHPSRVMEGYFIERNGRVEVHASVLDFTSRRTVQALAIAAPGAIAAANETAKQLSPAAQAMAVVGENAFREYGQAISSSDGTAVIAGLQGAAQSDPQFALAYIDWAKLLLSIGSREQALQVIQQGLRNHPDAVETADLEYSAAVAREDPIQREKALESLEKLTPADAKVYQELGDLESGARRFSEAVQNFEKASELDPENPAIWNQLGYTRAFAGDLNGAQSAEGQYQKLAPAEDVNPLDSLGEVSFYLGDFAAAERYFLQADQKNREEFAGVDLLKAAQARLMTGDLAGSNGLFQKYVTFVQVRDSGRAAYVRAQWQFLTGQRKAAMAALEKLIPQLQGDGEALALSQLSLWKMQSGDQNAAAALASAAEAHATGPAARNLSAACRAISQPASGSSGSQLGDAYALLFERKFSDAAPLLEKAYRETNPHVDGQIRTLLAWAYVETNRAGKAESLIGNYFLPLSSGDEVFVSMVFPRYLFVRAVVLQSEGKRAEAKTAYELFLKYTGDAPDTFGEEATARKNLSQL